MLKKLLCFFLALTLILSFAACDDKDDNDDWDDEEEELEEKANVPIPAPENFEETTIVQTEEYLVKVKSIEVQENEWATGDYILNLYFENYSDNTLSFYINGAVVNDISVPGYFQIEIPAGKKANESFSLSMYYLELADITQVTKVLFCLEPSYYNDEESLVNMPTEEVLLYPEGEDAYAPYVHTPGKEEFLFYEDNDFTVRIVDVIDDETGVYSLMVYFYNDTDKSYDIFLNNSAFNDYLMGDASFWNTRIFPESHSVMEISWDRNLLEENDIETVEKIWLNFRFTDPYDWSEYIEAENEFDTF